MSSRFLKLCAENRSNSAMQYVKSQPLSACVTFCTLLWGSVGGTAAAELSVTVHNVGGQAFANAVVVAEPAGVRPASHAPLKATVVQRDLHFVPDILVVRTGTVVDFPNADPVRHQVYSFSSAKKFQLSLYSGSAHPPILFDRPGIVTLGCNIHDSMIGYIYVTDSPWFARTDEAGATRFYDLPAGAYTVRIWHPRLRDAATALAQQITLAANANGAVAFSLSRAAVAMRHSGGTEQQWEDY
jgi:plastocyanin